MSLLTWLDRRSGRLGGALGRLRLRAARARDDRDVCGRIPCRLLRILLIQSRWPLRIGLEFLARRRVSRRACCCCLARVTLYWRARRRVLRREAGGEHAAPAVAVEVEGADVQVG